MIQSEFRHIDLLTALNENNCNLKNYYYYCCKNSFLSTLRNKRINNYLRIIDSDWKAYFLYFMYWVEKERHNILAEYAFYKNYFDRFTSDLAFFCNYDSTCKKPNYKRFYKENEIATFYKEIDGSKNIIKHAHALRNANPMSHASAELIDKLTTTKEIKECIKDLNSMIDNYRNTKSI